MVIQHIKKVSILAALFSFCLLAVTSRASSERDQDRTVEMPAIELIKQELQWNLPAFWNIGDIEIIDGFFPDNNKTKWKARFKVDIQTTEPTYFPEKETLGGTTVLRKIYDSGVKRQLRGRITAVKEEKKPWELSFEFDNRVTKSAGLPLDYFVGPVVMENSSEYTKLAKETLEGALQKTLEQHRAVLTNLRRTHAAEIASLKEELSSLESIKPLEKNIEERIASLRLALSRLSAQLDALSTDSAVRGPVIRQWASKALRTSNPQPRDRYSGAQALGPPDVDPGDTCRNSRPFKAWSGDHEGMHFLEVGFLEKVIPTQISVYEVNNPGFIKRLVFTGEKPGQIKRMDVIDINTACPGAVVFPVTGVPFPVSRIMIVINAEHSKGYESIDAVMLTGAVAEPSKP